MLNFIRNFSPQPILLEKGLVKIHWYGLIISLALLTGFFLFKRLALKRGLAEKHAYNLAFYLIIFGFIGARLFHVFFYNWPYFARAPWQIFAVWNGGLAITGGIIGGLIALYFYAKKNQLAFWLLADLIAIVLPLSQAIGRFGNYFNQELFGLPCAYFWCLPIDSANRPEAFLLNTYFHPVFLYEAVLNLALFFSLLWFLNVQEKKPGRIALFYLAGYAFIRFWMEFLRLDTGVLWIGLKPLQWLSVAVITVVIVFLANKKRKPWFS